MSPVLDAATIADALGQPRPTDQQAAVIEAPLVPSLVVAGAGSGKTETMAARVVYLLANSLARPNDILGLTFTRKAAGELAERVGKRIRALSASGLIDEPFDAFEAPTIATYNSFASSLFREHALGIGREPDATVLGEAAAWQLARRVVAASEDPELLPLGKSVDTITESVLALSAAMAENVVVDDELLRMTGRFEALANLPVGSNRVKSVYKSVADAVAAVGSLPVLVRLARTYSDEKIRRGLIEFSDQVALALEVCTSLPEVAASYRERFPVVLLDEYQDTSVVQTRLLSTLFAPGAVMAVGDPHQSIYGWRGASASNLGRFAGDFGGGEPTGSYALSTSWRNPPRVLAAANELVRPLSAASVVEVDELHPREGAGEGSLDVGFDETVLDEAARVADWLATRVRPRRDRTLPSAAILCRSLKKVAVFTKALAARGVRYRVLGIGGLLEEPAVADLVSVLHALDDPTSGRYLIRVLTGARHRIGVRDVKALRDVGGWLARRDIGHRPLADDVRQALRDAIGGDEGVSLIDALDFVAIAPEGHIALREISPDGLIRMRALAAELAELRRRSGLALIDLVSLVIEQSGLDIESSANESATLGRAALDSFLEVVEDFVSTDPAASLRSFLGWLQLAEQRENLGARAADPEPGTVQVLTIHGSKGLEWDFVVVPRMVEGELPSPPRSKRGWLSFGELPYDFRGDRLDLPSLAWSSCETQRDFDEAHKRYTDEVVRRDADEQRRLAYVAVTRAREALLLTGSFWSTQRKPRGPGRFLLDLRDAGLIAADALPDAPENEENPLDAMTDHVPWPTDPLGARRDRVEAAAEAVRVADPSATTRWTRQLDLLLAERDALRAAPAPPLPVRISASAFKDHVTDPDGVARALRRPMPQRPYRQTRLGTLFHSWVEHRSGVAGSGDLVDAFADELDIDLADGDLDRSQLAVLQASFEASEWAGLAPEAVELEVHLPFDDRIVICKLDAVYRRDGRYEVVDWKTGRPPKDAADLEQKTYQLALYRLAFAQWKGVDPSEVDAAFYFVADDRVIRPDTFPSYDDLLTRWRETHPGG
ncbi:ATP-dependent DNA helicase [Herbiconiux sp. L3-i23]|uniref:ATP-dependent DNA helicase n=1 Tax=Herbiconiux sp. L3-i23 TaxID=2905871 RepID=UPI00205EA9D8|nr:ATP-dependent DNA helicase [Herbiconiux sp. L3-i23]BDI23450.1 ATP-dependent DNA helicase [Herbiconiux sp. L3-i23]